MKATLPVLNTSLPEFCYFQRRDGSLALIERGLPGCRTVPVEVAHDQARLLNERLGITRAQECAMQMGAMFGFHVPGADPAFYAPFEKSPGRRMLDECHRATTHGRASNDEVPRAA